MRKRLAKSVAFGLTLVLGLVMLSCTPAAPTPTPAPTPARPEVPQLPTPGKPAPAPAAPRKTVEVAMPPGPMPGVSAVQAVVFSKLLKDHSAWLRGSPMFVSGWGAGVEYWNKNKDRGVFMLYFSQPMVAEYAQGVRSYKDQGPRKDQGLLWPLFVQDLLWVSREGSRFKAMEDVKDAKIGLGPPGSTSLVMATQMLEFGMGLKLGDYKAVYATNADLASLFKEGTIQVTTWGHIASKGIPYAYLEDLASSVRLQFIPNTQAQVDKMNEALGADVYFLHVLPAGIYRNMTKDVPWQGNIAFTTLPTMYFDEIAYELCRVWWDYHDEGVELNPVFGHSSPELCQQTLKKKWPFDTHPGALKYYKERGWI